MHSRANARAILRVNLAQILYAKVPEKPTRQFPKIRFECTKCGASWRVGRNCVLGAVRLKEIFLEYSDPEKDSFGSSGARKRQLVFVNGTGS